MRNFREWLDEDYLNEDDDLNKEILDALCRDFADIYVQVHSQWHGIDSKSGIPEVIKGGKLTLKKILCS